MKRILTIIFVMLVCSSASPLLASTSVYPVKGVFGFDAPVLRQKAPAFAGMVAYRGIPALEKEFDAEFRKVFGSLATVSSSLRKYSLTGSRVKADSVATSESKK